MTNGSSQNNTSAFVESLIEDQETVMPIASAQAETSILCRPQIGEGVAEWLTRKEWNACYFLGQEAFFRDRVKCGLCDQVSIGMERLRDAGYGFERIQIGTSGLLEPIPGEMPSRMHDRSCGEVAEGAFDDIGRAREALRWLRDRVPGVSAKWLEDILALYDRAHGPHAL